MAAQDSRTPHPRRAFPVQAQDTVDDRRGGAQPGPARVHQAERSDSDPAPQVVVGIDGSPASHAALQWAVRHADTTGATVHAVAAWHRPAQFGANALTQTPEKDFEAEARARLVAAVPQPAPDEPRPRVHTHTEQGDPAAVLIDHARSAELLVLGNQRHGRVAGAVLGSVALGAAHHARCPVVLVPAPTATEGDATG